MEDYIQFSAKTKSEAITKACIELGVSSDQLEIQVISEGSNGFFGIGSKPAVIKVRKIEPVSEEEEMKEIVETVKLDSFKEEAPVQEEKKTEAIKPVKKEIKEPKAVSEKPRQPKPVKERAAKEKQPREFREPKEKQVREKTTKPVKPVEILTDPEEIKEVENRAKVFLRDVFASMNLGEVEITSKYNTTDGSLEVDFEGEDMGILIGKRGQTLDSLQYLTSLVVNKGKSNYIRVKLDTEDYRKRRKETLENLARGIAYKVRKTRKPVILEPMNPYERRIIHSALQGNKFVETVSEGEEPYRHVVVKLKRN
jgi:spoIIIJ-associated protein